MALVTEEVVVAGKGELYIAPVGTSLPITEGGALHADFVGLGYTSEDGVAMTYEIEKEGIRAWQTLDILREVVTSRNLSFATSGLQWNPDSIALAFGGGEWTEPTPGHHRYDFPKSGDAPAEYAVVLEFKDGDKVYRVVVERASVADSVETNLVNNAPALLPVTMTALAPSNAESGPAYLLTNDAGIGEDLSS